MTGFSSDLLKDKLILITGAGKGIGRRCAEVAIACGARVIAVARTRSDLDDLADQCGDKQQLTIHSNSNPSTRPDQTS